MKNLDLLLADSYKVRHFRVPCVDCGQPACGDYTDKDGTVCVSCVAGINWGNDIGSAAEFYDLCGKYNGKWTDVCYSYSRNTWYPQFNGTNLEGEYESRIQAKDALAKYLIKQQELYK